MTGAPRARRPSRTGARDVALAVHAPVALGARQRQRRQPGLPRPGDGEPTTMSERVGQQLARRVDRRDGHLFGFNAVMAPVARGARLPVAIVTTPIPVTDLLRALARVHVRTETESCVFGALGRYGAT